MATNTTLRDELGIEPLADVAFGDVERLCSRGNLVAVVRSQGVVYVAKGGYLFGADFGGGSGKTFPQAIANDLQLDRFHITARFGVGGAIGVLNLDAA